jgi:hypothetical protein
LPCLYGDTCSRDQAFRFEIVVGLRSSRFSRTDIRQGGHLGLIVLHSLAKALIFSPLFRGDFGFLDVHVALGNEHAVTEGVACRVICKGAGRRGIGRHFNRKALWKPE